MLGERFKLNGNCFLALLFFANLALGDETGIVFLGILAAAVLHVLRHGFLVELFVITHHALSILNHSGKHGCQSVTFILVKAGKFSKAKNTTMLSLAIFVDVRLRETIVIICDCCTISLIAIFLCLGYIHFGGKGTHNFLTGKTGGCSILGIFPNIRRKLGFFMQNQLGNWLKTAKI